MTRPLVFIGACIALGLSAHCAPVHDATPTTCPAGQEPSGALCVCISTQAPPIDGSCDTTQPGDGGTACSIDDCEDDGNPCTEPTCPEGGGTCENEPAIDQTDCEIEEGAGSCVQGVCIVDSPAWELGRPFQIGGGMDEIVWPKVELAADGTGIATWAEGNRLMASHFDPEGGWGDPIGIEEEIFPSWNFFLGVDGVGNAVIVFASVATTSVDVRAARYDSVTGLWHSSEVISRDGAVASGPTVRVAGDGTVWAAWSEAPGEIVLRRTRTTGLSWDPPVIVPQGDASPKGAPSMSSPHEGGSAVLFRGYRADGNAQSLWAATVGPDGSAETPERIDLETGLVGLAQIASTEDGGLMVVWQEADDILYARFANERWDAPAQLEASGDPAHSPVVAADGGGNFVVAWCQAGDVRTRRFLAADERWEDIEILYRSNDDRLLRPSLGVGPEEDAWLVWVVSYFIHWSYFVPDSRWSVDAKLSDTLQVKNPPPEHAPWLSTAADGTIAVVWGDGRSVWAWADRR